MKVNLLYLFTIVLFGCSIDYSGVKHPELGIYYNKQIDEQIIILDTSTYVHVYNRGKSRDTSTYVFNPGIKEVNYWGQIRFVNFHDNQGIFSNRRVNDPVNSVIYSFSYSPESFYTGDPVIVSNIEEVNKGFDFSK